MTLLFRIRYPLHVLLFALGFWAPWNYVLQLDPSGPSAHVWGTLAALLSRNFVLSIIQAFDLLLIIAIVFAAAGALLRTWGTAYLTSGVVRSGRMHTGEAAEGTLVADGPYRHLRNPLYAGTFLHAIALSLLMPASGAVFTIVTVGALQWLLISGEQRFLSAKLGAAYQAYCTLVPSLWPRLRARVQSTGLRPRWGQALLGEFYFWGVLATYAAAGWQYNAQVLVRGVLISFGAAIVLRALLPAKPKAAERAA